MRESQGGRNRIMVLQHKEQPCCSCYLTSAANSLDLPRSLAKGENSHQVSFSLPWGGLFLREKRNSAGKGKHQTLALKSWQIQSWHWRADLYYEFSKSIHNSNRKSTGINAYRLKKKKKVLPLGSTNPITLKITEFHPRGKIDELARPSRQHMGSLT